MALSAVKKLKQLDDERNKILAEAKQEAMDGVEAALAALNELGFSYRLAEGRGGASRRGTRTAKDAPCSVCGFKTSPLHDGRAHRSHKAPFTDAELKQRGMKRV